MFLDLLTKYTHKIIFYFNEFNYSGMRKYRFLYPNDNVFYKSIFVIFLFLFWPFIYYALLKKINKNNIIFKIFIFQNISMGFKYIYNIFTSFTNFIKQKLLYKLDRKIIFILHYLLAILSIIFSLFISINIYFLFFLLKIIVDISVYTKLFSLFVIYVLGFFNFNIIKIFLFIVLKKYIFLLYIILLNGILEMYYYEF